VALSVSQTNTFTLCMVLAHEKSNPSDHRGKQQGRWTYPERILECWAEIKESKMHVCWMRLFPESVQDFKGFDESPEDATKEVVHLMNELNLYQH